LIENLDFRHESSQQPIRTAIIKIMDFWPKLIGSVRNNPERVMPTILVAVIAALVGALLLVNSISNKSKVPTPFKIKDPEAAAIQIKQGDKVLVKIPRRAVAAWQEMLARQAFSSQALRQAIAKLPAEQQKLFKSSPSSFCSQQLKGIDPAKTASDPDRPLFNNCLILFQSQLPAVQQQITQDAILLAWAKTNNKMPSAASQQAARAAAYQQLLRATGSSLKAEALRKVGLTRQDLATQALIGLARDSFNSQLRAPTQSQLKQEFASDPERYQTPAKYRPLVYAFPAGNLAKKGAAILRSGGSLAEMRQQKIAVRRLPSSWLSAIAFSSSQLAFLASASAGSVSNPFPADGSSLVMVAGEKRLALPPKSFLAVKKQVREYLMIQRQQAQQKRLNSVLREWLPEAYCEEVLPSTAFKLDCQRSDHG